MSFLDNLENSLKSLENREERDGAEAQRRESDKARAEAIGPWAEKLRASAYTRALMEYATESGRRIRSKIYMAWLQDVLRLEAKGKTCELYPTPGGIEARYFRPLDEEQTVEKVNLDKSPKALIDRWLEGIEQPS